MEVLLEEFQEQFERLFLRLMRMQEQQSRAVKQWLESERADLRDYLQGLEATGSGLVTGLSEQVRDLRTFVTEHREKTHMNVVGMLKLTKAEREKMLDDLSKQMTVLVAENHQAIESRAFQLVAIAGSAYKTKHLKASLESRTRICGDYGDCTCCFSKPCYTSPISNLATNLAHAIAAHQPISF
jgi:hypothetical protein